MLDKFPFMKRILQFKNSDALSSLSTCLFRSVPYEDLESYQSSVLEFSVSAATRSFSQYRKGQAIISVDSGSDIKRNGTLLTIFTIVNDNMPFLFDSVLSEITDAAGYPFLAAHPIIDTSCDRQGQSVENAESDRVSLIQIHVSRLSDEKAEALRQRLFQLLNEIRMVVHGWKPMLDRLNQAISEMRHRPVPLSKEAVEEAIAFLEWLRDDNFIFFGMREFGYSRILGRKTSVPTRKSGLGILADPDAVILSRDSQANKDREKEMQALFRGSDPLVVGMTNIKSRIHRRVYMTYIALKIFDSKGILSGQLHITGLFSSAVSVCSVMRIPYLRSKAVSVIAGSGFDLRDHAGKALINVLETYPRDELFQMGVPMLRKHCEAILNLIDRPRVRVFIRVDPFDRFVSILVFVPRDRYDSVVREKIGVYLETLFQGHISAFQPSFPEDSLARVHFLIDRESGKTPKVKSVEVESSIRQLVRTWEDALREEAAVMQSDAEHVDIALKFPETYRNSFSPARALVDAARTVNLTEVNSIDLIYYRRRDQKVFEATLNIYHCGVPVSLSRRVPILENMGFRVISERTFEVVNRNMASVFLHEMTLESRFHLPIDLSEGDALLRRTFLSVWHGRSGNDGYNALAHTAGLAPENLSVLRAFGRYLQQVPIAQSQGFIASVLNRYPLVAGTLYKLFSARFGPSIQNRNHKVSDLKSAIEEYLKNISNVDDDFIIRRYLNLIESCLRTNHFSPASVDDSCCFAIKLDSSLLHGLPDPRPWREIFVYGPEVEGIHLRFGAVSRGGLRWSDRAQDYRTEVLGLVKAQQVKNAVIVPFGAKGAFYPKLLASGGGRDEILQAGLRAYTHFVSSLLSLTDNLQEGRVVSPPGIVSYDQDDPYFVVAADKGTSTFSDTANQISMAQGFWLDDAFASGGSAGYDHKKMGITARGAWEAVSRHFREMNHDIYTRAFTVAGVGDMSGDVFGNGMLLSPKIRLIAAFDHRDIFIDPCPDEAISFSERQRLFCLPRSSWQDYDRTRLSLGGMIFSRFCKSVSLTPQARAAIGLEESESTPASIIKAILKLEVDLLWFGGIGTYVKDSTEDNDKVADHTNDFIRIDACELCAKVIAEGANLALTQRARVRFCLNGGSCNSDAIDNSAGVNSSDLEVNIKIALADAMKQGILTRPVRDKLLLSMTSEVSRLVLSNNYQQTLSISLVSRRGLADLNHQERFIASLEQRGLLNRQLEELPSPADLHERKIRGKPLTRSEIGVLLAYAKISLFSDILASNLPDDSCFDSSLINYFPRQMQKKYSESIQKHPLRREIIARSLANEIINRGGPEFVIRLEEETGQPTHEVVRAFWVVSEGFELRNLFSQIDALDNRIDGKEQLDLYLFVTFFIYASVSWELKNADFSLSADQRICNLRKARTAIESRLANFFSEVGRKELEEQEKRLLVLGVSSPLANRLALLETSELVSDVAVVARLSNLPISHAAHVFFGVTNAFRIDRIQALVRFLPLSDYYEEMAVSCSLDMISRSRRSIAIDILLRFGSVRDPLHAWVEAGGETLSAQLQRFLFLSEGAEMSMARLMLISTSINDFLRSSGSPD